MKLSLAMILALCAVPGPLSAQTLQLASPDGLNSVRFEKSGPELTYSVDYCGQAAILPSRAELEVDNRVWEMALGKRDLEQPDSWMTLLTADFSWVKPGTIMRCTKIDTEAGLRNTHAHQLAASVVMYSPLQTILWYDTPDRYHGEPEIKWFEELATTFDDTRVLSGYPGEGVTVARRKGDSWWVGALANNDGGSCEIPLSFLDPARCNE